MCIVDTTWRISSKSAGTNCVEISRREDVILVRDSKNRAKGALSIPPQAWEDFTKAIKSGQMSGCSGPDLP